MTINFYVYLDEKNNKLVIASELINDENHKQLVSSSVEDSEINRASLLYFCKMFCFGYMMGSTAGKTPINDINEFK